MIHFKNLPLGEGAGRQTEGGRGSFYHKKSRWISPPAEYLKVPLKNIILEVLRKDSKHHCTLFRSLEYPKSSSCYLHFEKQQG